MDREAEERIGNCPENGGLFPAVLLYRPRHAGPWLVSGPEDLSNYTLDIVVEDQYQLLKHLGVDKGIIGSLSLGGTVALSFFEKHWEMCLGLILWTPAPVSAPPQWAASETIPGAFAFFHSTTPPLAGSPALDLNKSTGLGLVLAFLLTRIGFYHPLPCFLRQTLKLFQQDRNVLLRD